MKIYLDNCCYNRILDDRSYPQIYYERNSVMLILEQMIYKLCSKEVKIDSFILDRAEEIRHSSNIKYKDSIHLACAEAAKVNALLTTDRKFMNNSNRIKTYTKVTSPNQWLLEVLY